MKIPFFQKFPSLWVRRGFSLVPQKWFPFVSGSKSELQPENFGNLVLTRSTKWVSRREDVRRYGSVCVFFVFISVLQWLVAGMDTFNTLTRSVPTDIFLVLLSCFLLPMIICVLSYHLCVVIIIFILFFYIFFVLLLLFYWLEKIVSHKNGSIK